MLQLSKTLINVPVMSLRIGGQVATATQPIINPNNLKIEGWHCIDSRSKEQLILLSQDVRELLPQGLVINDYDVLSDPDDLIRLKDIIAMDFPLIGHNVVSETKRRLGKVTDFSTEITTFYIKKLYASQSMLRNLKGGSLAIDRDQIVEINDKKIIVKDPQQPLRAQEMAVPGPQTIQSAPAMPIQ